MNPFSNNTTLLNSVDYSYYITVSHISIILHLTVYHTSPLCFKCIQILESPWGSHEVTLAWVYKKYSCEELAEVEYLHRTTTKNGGPSVCRIPKVSKTGLSEMDRESGE